MGDGCPDGLSTDDMEASQATLESMCETLLADLSLLRERPAEVKSSFQSRKYRC